jgi:DNA primase small subunit
MNSRTFRYLSGRFRDYYRRTSLELPPEIDGREWGYIPWTEDGRTFMIRHKSIQQIGDPQTFLANEHPRHLYTTASKYEDPSAPSMDEKRWESADLIFDIDIDDQHLPDYIDAEGGLSHNEELALAKKHLLRLLDVLDTDFGFEDVEIVFSGGRGYHVHVRDDSIQTLDSKQRSELVAYIQGVNIDLDSLVKETGSTVNSRVTGADSKAFKPGGGWTTRVHKRLVEELDWALDIVDEFHEDEAVDRLVQRDFHGIGKKKAQAIITGFLEHEMEIRAGVVSVSPAIKSLTKALVDEVHTDTYADIDEPVSTDINRLIRLPGSLHGRTGFVVTRISRDDIDSFDPFADAVADVFTGREIEVEVTEETEVTALGTEYEFECGTTSVPEAVGIYLMAQGVAELA